MADNELKIKISGDAKGFKKAADETKSEAESLSKITSKLSLLGVAAATAAAAAVFKGVQAYKEAEQATNALNQSLAQQGIFTAELSKQYKQYAEELQKTTTFDDDAIVSGTAKIQSFLGQTKVTKELLQATLDFAAAQKIDLKSAADLVGKSIGSQTNALTRYGVTVDSSASKQEKLAAVIDGLNKKFGGQAAAAAQGLGSIEQLSNAVGDVFEIIGKAAAPAVGLVTTLLKDFAVSASGSQSALNGLSFVFAKIGEQISATVSIVNILGGSIGVGLASAVEAASQAVRGNFSSALNLVKQGAQEIGRIYDEENQKHIDRVTAQNNALIQIQNDQSSNETDLLRQSEANKTVVAREEAITRFNELEAVRQEKELLAAELLFASEEQKNALRLAAIEKDLAQTSSGEERKKLLVQKGEIQRAEIERKYQALRLEGYQTFLGGVASLQESSNKQLASVGKAFAIADATIKAYQAIQNALATVPFPANIAAAAGIGVQAFVNVSKIAGVKFADGGLVTGGVPGTDSVPALLMPGELVVPQQNFEEVISAVANQRQATPSAGGGGSSGMMEVIIGFTENAFEIIEQKVIERRATGVGLI